MKKKVLAFVLVFALALTMGIGGTIAWLTDVPDPVTNTFTIGKVDIELTETFNTDGDDEGTEPDSWSIKFVPGTTVAKDPTIKVVGGSEKCYVFVKIEESIAVKSGTANFSDYFTYGVRTPDTWTQLKDRSDKAIAGVYYTEVAASDTDTTLYVLTSNKKDANDALLYPYGEITVKDTVTNEMVANLNGNPTLKVSAAAVQFENMVDAYDAWTKLPPALTGISG